MCRKYIVRTQRRLDFLVVQMPLCGQESIVVNLQVGQMLVVKMVVERKSRLITLVVFAWLLGHLFGNRA